MVENEKILIKVCSVKACVASSFKEFNILDCELTACKDHYLKVRDLIDTFDITVNNLHNKLARDIFLIS